MSTLDVAVKDYPTEAERDAYSAYLANPMGFPPEFRAWLADWLSVNIPFIPVAQLQGYSSTVAQNAITNVEVDMSGGDRSWYDPTDGLGPSISKLADGTYFVAFGCKTGRSSAGGTHTRYGPSNNGADPTEYAEFAATDPDAMVWKAQLMTLSNGGNNTVSMKYWYDNGGGAVAQYLHRWLTVMRVT